MNCCNNFQWACITFPTAGGVGILLCLFITCCCCYRRRKNKIRESRKRQSGIEEQEQNNSIDLATGQISGEQEIRAESNDFSPTDKKMKSKLVALKDTPIICSDNRTRTQSLVTTKSEKPVPSTPISPPAVPPRPHTLEEKNVEAEQNDIDTEEPSYDTIETVLEHQWQASGEHSYHILCGPNNSQHDKSEARNSGPYYDEVISSGVITDNTLASNNVDTEGQYNILDSGIEPNPIQKGIIQEDSNNEDKYYSMPQGHRLVPVGRRFSQNYGNNLYEGLSQEETNSQSGDNGYDQIQPRHNTFTSLTNLEKQKKAVIRCQSATGHTLETLDPMYDEPIVKNPANNINSNSLFDDPKYACKDDHCNPSRQQRVENISQPQVLKVGERKAVSRKTQ